MKQQITQEQLHEISFENQLLYIKTLHLDIPGKALMLSDIGYLIWFLEDYMRGKTGWWALSKSSPDIWTVMIKDDEGATEEVDGKELVDVLWEAVKFLLNER